MRRIIIHDYWGDHVGPWLSGLVAYFTERGSRVDTWSRSSFRRSAFGALRRPQTGLRGRVGRSAIKRRLEGVDHVFTWNGQQPHDRILVSLCHELRIPLSYLEVGYFPQSTWFTIDSAGINATASLMTDSLEWINAQHLRRLREFRSAYLDGRVWRGRGDYILVPLQLATDTNVRDNSDVTDMQEFISRCERRFEGRHILFKIHPRDDSEYVTGHEIVKGGNFLDLAVDANEVVGINSTCLLESVLLGAPTESLGDGFLRAHGGREEQLLAALVDKQVPVGTTNIEYWMTRYSSRRADLPGSQ